MAEIKKIYPNQKDAIALASEKIKQLCDIEKSGGKDIKSIITESQKFKNKNEDLSKQIVHLVELQKGLGKGADYPPCWLDDNNKIEYIFNVVIDDFGIEVFDIKPRKNISHNGGHNEKDKQCYSLNRYNSLAGCVRQ